MKTLVLGAGVIGTATAWYLSKRGHEVTVIDRRAVPGLETSFANGGQISVCHAEPWANPEAPEQIVKWLWRDDAPLLFRLRMDPRQWAWGAQFLLECLPSRTRRNIGDIVKMSLYSRTSLQELRSETGIQYDQLELGILHYYTQPDVFESAVKAASVMREYGLERDVKTVDEAVAIEPALGPRARGSWAPPTRRPTNRATPTSLRRASRSSPRRGAPRSSPTTRSCASSTRAGA